jgi:hypothetical protein
VGGFEPDLLARKGHAGQRGTSHLAEQGVIVDAQQRHVVWHTEARSETDFR